MPLRILIVEDDPAGLMALTDALLLRLKGATVDGASSAERALPLITAHDYDCIVCDIVMPGVDGRALLQAIRTLRPEVAVVLVTARDFHVREQAIADGAHAFLAKPLDVDVVVQTILSAAAQTAKNREAGRDRS